MNSFELTGSGRSPASGKKRTPAKPITIDMGTGQLVPPKLNNGQTRLLGKPSRSKNDGFGTPSYTYIPPADVEGDIITLNLLYDPLRKDYLGTSRQLGSGDEESSVHNQDASV